MVSPHERLSLFQFRSRTKVERDLALLDTVRCNGEWDLVPALLKKLEQRSPDRRCGFPLASPISHSICSGTLAVQIWLANRGSETQASSKQLDQSTKLVCFSEKSPHSLVKSSESSYRLLPRSSSQNSIQQRMSCKLAYAWAGYTGSWAKRSMSKRSCPRILYRPTMGWRGKGAVTSDGPKYALSRAPF